MQNLTVVQRAESFLERTARNIVRFTARVFKNPWGGGGLAATLTLGGLILYEVLK